MGHGFCERSDNETNENLIREDLVSFTLNNNMYYYILN